MSSEASAFIPDYVKRIALYTRENYKDSLCCELVKETFAVLEKLVVSSFLCRDLLDETIAVL
jgi:hypothetical protein